MYGRCSMTVLFRQKTEYLSTIGVLYAEAVTSKYNALFVFKGENYGKLLWLLQMQEVRKDIS